MDDLSALLGIGTEIHTASHVGAGDIQFQSVGTTCFFNSLGQLAKFIVRLASDANHDGGVELLEVLQVSRDKGINAVVVEADRVQQSCRSLDGSPWCVAGARGKCDRLGENSAECVELDEFFHLSGVTESSGSHQYRILKFESPKLDAQVH